MMTLGMMSTVSADETCQKSKMITMGIFKFVLKIMSSVSADETKKFYAMTL
jgi:hypothetical protein